MSLCPEVLKVKIRPEEVSCRRAHCKRWECDHCGPHRRKRVFAEVLAGRPDKLLTLTVDAGRPGDPDDHAVELSKAAAALLKEARRLNPGQELAYYAVFESTQRGEPHLHVALRAPFLDQGWISGFMEARIGAPVVDIRRFKNPKRIPGYLAKYLAKDPHRFIGTKRYWHSQNWTLEPWQPGPEDDSDILTTLTVSMRVCDFIHTMNARGFVMREVGACRWQGTTYEALEGLELHRGLSP